MYILQSVYNNRLERQGNPNFDDFLKTGSW